MSVPLLQPAYTSGLIDQNNVLMLSWQPSVVASDGVTPVILPTNYFADWLISLTSSNPAINVTVPPPAGFGVGSIVTYSQTLGISALSYSLTMTAQSSTPGTVANSLPWQTNNVSVARAFPTLLTSFDATFTATSLQLGQPLTVTLVGAYLGADSWQVIWPDNSSTGWLPLSPNTRTAIKSFSSSGTFYVVVQTRRNYSGTPYNPPATLISQFKQQIYVTTTQYPTAPTSQSGLMGNLGVGGSQGFEITQVSATQSVSTPWEVITRALVRDTVTSELKLLIATSRFNNASSLYGTMALDVFPISGRVRSKELIEPPYELTAANSPTATPVQITTPALPTLYVGKSVVQALGFPFAMAATGGTAPYIWSSDPFPPGVTMNSSGVVNGTPLELGIFSVTISVQDSSDPFSVAQATFSESVTTDMKVQIATGQVDANSTALSPTGFTLGVAQVGLPYNVSMIVGNIESGATLPGGLPPYTWSAPAGNFPQGLTITSQPNGTGLISGTPSTYNSTTDFSVTYTVTIQVTDAIGAVATQTYSMTLEPQALRFGFVNQPTVYAFEEFKLVIPVFGGQSPYTFSPGADFQPSGGDAAYYGAVRLADGQIGVNIGGSSASTPGGFPTFGVRTFHLSIADSASPPNTITSFPISYNVEPELSDLRFVPGYLTNPTHPTDGSWGLGDYSKAIIPLSGSIADLEAYTLNGFRANFTSVANAVGGQTVYTGIVGGTANVYANEWFAVSGFPLGSPNNGVFLCSASSATSLTLGNAFGTLISATTFSITSVAAASLGSTVYTGTITGGGSNAYAGQFVSITGYTVNPQNNGVFYCTASTSSTLTLLNAAGVSDTNAASGTLILGKGLQAQTQSGLQNGLTVALDPTVVINTPQLYPDVEFYGPPGAQPITNGNGVYGNAQTLVSLILTPTFALNAVTAVTPGTSTTYLWNNPAGASNAYAGQNITVTGFQATANNGTFNCISSSATTLVLANTAGVRTTITVVSSSLTSPTLTAVFGAASTLPLVGQVVNLSGFLEVQINSQQKFTIATLQGTSPNWTGFTASFTGTTYSQPTETTALVTIPNPNAQAALPLASATVTREYTTLAHKDPATQVLTQVTANSPMAGQATYLGNITVGAGNAFAGFYFAINGFTTNITNNGYFACVSSSATQLVLSNANAINETNPATATGDIGAIVVTPRPYIVGDVIGLNPRKPYFNSPNLPQFNDGTVVGSSPYTSIPLTARVLAGSTLPPGLSLDANTGLIYGTLSGVAANATSTIQYIDAAGALHGSATITWATYSNAFQLTDNNVLDSLTLGSPISVNAFTAPPSINLISASTLAGRLPAGLVVSVSSNNVVVSGTPTEVGYFDVWFQTQNASGQFSYVYHRVSTVLPLATLNVPGWADVTALPLVLGATNPFPLPTATIGNAYVDPLTALPVAMVGVNGVPPYTWASSPAFPFNGITLATSGATAGTFSGSATSTFSQLFSFTVTDADANTFTVNNVPLQAQPSGLVFNAPFTLNMSAGRTFSQTLTATAGSAPYSYTISPLNTNALPTGISVATGGVVSGTTIQAGYSKTVILRVTDSLYSINDQPFTVTVTSGLTLMSGPDYQQSTSTGYLGYIDLGNVSSINPATNLSFYVIASSIASTSTSTMSVSLQGGVSGITAAITNLNTSTHTAEIQLTGPFSSGATGDNTIVVSVTDSGVQATQTFKWKVFADGTLILTPSSGSFPTQFLNT